MKRKKLNFMDIKEEDTLDREEMKFIMAGSGGSGGNIYCSIGSWQLKCYLPTLTQCTDSCADLAGALGGSCSGCGQFPEL